MAKSFNKTEWDTGMSPVARDRTELCSVCERGTEGRSFCVEDQVMCETCAESSVTGLRAGLGSSTAWTMLLGMAAMVLISVLYVMMHLSDH